MSLKSAVIVIGLSGTIILLFVTFLILMRDVNPAPLSPGSGRNCSICHEVNVPENHNIPIDNDTSEIDKVANFSNSLQINNTENLVLNNSHVERLSRFFMSHVLPEHLPADLLRYIIESSPPVETENKMLTVISNPRHFKAQKRSVTKDRRKDLNAKPIILKILGDNGKPATEIKTLSGGGIKTENFDVPEADKDTYSNENQYSKNTTSDSNIKSDFTKFMHGPNNNNVQRISINQEDYGFTGVYEAVDDVDKDKNQNDSIKINNLLEDHDSEPIEKFDKLQHASLSIETTEKKELNIRQNDIDNNDIKYGNKSKYLIGNGHANVSNSKRKA